MVRTIAIRSDLTENCGELERQLWRPNDSRSDLRNREEQTLGNKP